MQIDVEIADNLPVVYGNEIQLEQALVNLCLNARDALAGLSGRQPNLTIEARPSPLSIEKTAPDCMCEFGLLTTVRA